MSEHITHIAICEDTTRLVAFSNEFSEPFKESLRRYPDAGLISSGSRGNHLIAIPIMEKVREQWKQKKDSHRYAELLAASIGWLSHRAIDLQVKPNYVKQEKIESPRYSTYENQIYYDAITFDKVYGAGEYPSISPNVAFSKATLDYSMAKHPGAKLLHVAHFEPLMVSMVQQHLLSLRNFNEETSTLEEWLETYPNQYQKLSENLEVYIEAFTDPDPMKMKRYEEELNFYDENDELIKLVRELQHKGTSSIDLFEAAKKAEKQSHYAQGLSRSYRFIRSAHLFFQKKITKDEVYDQVEIFHKPHRL